MPPACPWPRVQCYKGILISLRLAHLNLSSTFDFAALEHLPGLHSINLKRNSFSGPLPVSLATVCSLHLMYLSHNVFTGPVPGDVFTSMRWLKKLYLNNNDLSEALPADAIAGAPRLLKLHLEHNRIEGPIPSFLLAMRLVSMDGADFDTPPLHSPQLQPRVVQGAPAVADARRAPHPNVPPPIGCHYHKELKLVVSEYMPHGGLLYASHRDQSSNRPARLKIIVGVARGTACLLESSHGSTYQNQASILRCLTTKTTNSESRE